MALCQAKGKETNLYKALPTLPMFFPIYHLPYIILTTPPGAIGIWQVLSKGALPPSSKVS